MSYAIHRVRNFQQSKMFEVQEWNGNIHYNFDVITTIYLDNVPLRDIVTKVEGNSSNINNMGEIFKKIKIVDDMTGIIYNLHIIVNLYLGYVIDEYNCKL